MFKRKFGVRRGAQPDSDRVISDARAGDHDAFGALYRDHVAIVYGYFRACGLEEADDLTSEVFLGVLRGLPSFVGGPTEFRSWLMTIAYRRRVDHLRQRSADRAHPHEPTKLAMLSQGNEPLRLDFDPRLIESFLNLTVDQREVLALRFVADLSLERVAAITGRPVGAVKSLQHRGLRTLRIALTDTGATSEALTR